MRKNSFTILCAILLLACNNELKTNKEEKYVDNQDHLESAFLVCRLGNGYFSKFFRMYASKEQKYSHIGILSNENDTFFVYHAEASELTGVGYVKRESLGSFLYDIKTYDYFKLNYPDSIKLKIVQKAKSYNINRTAFDLDFNSQDDSELYCSELIAVSINHALNKNEIKPGLILNGKALYTLDDIYLNENIERVIMP